MVEEPDSPSKSSRWEDFEHSPGGARVYFFSLLIKFAGDKGT